MTVRPAAVADADAIARVHVEAWQVAYEHVFGAERLAALSVGERAERWRRSLGDPQPGSETFVAVRAREVVGFVSVGPCRDTDARATAGELYGIYVRPMEWGSGAGAALLERAVTALCEAGHAAASLWVLEDNPRARAFYELHGWFVDGASKRAEFLGVEIDEVRYRIALEAAP